MKKFTLQSSYYVDENSVIYVQLKPTDIFIENFIASNHELVSKADITSQIEELIAEMTPILYYKFQDMDSISLDLKNQYEL